jgi:hypothetical protein
MRAAMFRLNQIETEEQSLKNNPDLLTERKVKLIHEYGFLMTELTQAVLTDACMPFVEPPNMVALAEKYYSK